MAIKIGLVGLPQSGKTTLFNALTGKQEKTGVFAAAPEEHIATISVPDARVEYLSDIYKPKKKTHAYVDFVDVGGQISQHGKEVGKEDISITNLRQVDALAHVVRLFENDSVPHPAGSLDSIRDVEKLNTDLILADMMTIEKRLEKIDLNIKKLGKTVAKNDELEKHLLERLQKVLDEGKFLLEVELSEDERKIVKGYCFLTLKPTIYIANIGENQVGQPANEQLKKLTEYADSHQIPCIDVCGTMEMEIMQLPENERADFLKEMGIEISGRTKLLQAAYKACRLISFLTTGEDEVRAWTIIKGTLAPKAAGTIHGDFEQGFIRAEVINYKDFVEVGGMANARHKGLLRLEGKEYIVQDGDIINFRFNV